MIDIETGRDHVEQFLSHTDVARLSSQRARDYVDNKQWTQDEEAKLRQRGQAAIVVNRIAPKVEGLKGLLLQRATDPKAFPRTQAHEDAANAVTDALRYVADNTDMAETKLEVADDVFVEGYGGCIVEVDGPETAEITITRIPWDRIYFDPHSRLYDFSDCRYMGIILWMDLEDARRVYGEQVELVDMGEESDQTLDDRPRWSDLNKGRKRIRVAQEFLLHEGQWHTFTFSGQTILVEPELSPYLDVDGEPTNPIELVSAHIDRENHRFGEVQYWIDLQDEINHRRSKALHLLSVRQTASRRGAVDDIPSMKREMAKADGHVEYDGAQGDFEVLPTGDMAQGQFALLEEAKNEIDAVGFNAQLAGERQGNLSGKAIIALQGAGSNEIANLFNRINGWEKRIYRQVWARIRQFWNRERWVRVLDDERQLRWVGFNIQVTVQQALEEVINDKAKPEEVRRQAAEAFTSMMQVQDPRLQQLTEVRNSVPELDMDIQLEQSLDTINVQQEQFELLANMAQTRPEVPFTSLLRLSTFRDKDELIEKIEEGQKAQAELAQQAAQMEIEIERQKIQAKAEADMAVQQEKLLSNERIAAAEIELERQKAEIQLQLKHDTTQLEKSVHETAARAIKRQVIEIPGVEQFTAALEKLAEAKEQDSRQIAALLAELQRRVEVVRDEEGRIQALA